MAAGGEGVAWVPVEQPLDLAVTLQSGQAFRWRPGGGWWSGFIGREMVLLRQVESGVEARGAGPATGLADSVARYLRLDDDLPAIYDRLCQDTRLHVAVDRHQGLRLLRQEPWECLVAFICSANSNIARIGAVQEAIAEALGQPASVGGATRSAFPEPKAVASAGEERLRALGLGFRAPYVAAAAVAVATGALPLEALRTATYGEARQALMAVPGVGEKVADCVLLFSLEKLESFPVDRWVRRSVEEWYLEGRRLPYRELAAWARERFGPLAGYAQQYLFQGRRLEGRGGRGA